MPIQKRYLISGTESSILQEPQQTKYHVINYYMTFIHKPQNIFANTIFGSMLHGGCIISLKR